MLGLRADVGARGIELSASGKTRVLVLGTRWGLSVPALRFAGEPWGRRGCMPQLALRRRARAEHDDCAPRSLAASRNGKVIFPSWLGLERPS
jgi:hypothetical protein